MNPAIRLMQDYLAALAARDLAAIEQMSDAHSLVEIPFITPNRLIGTTQIVRAHREIFANLEQVRFEVTRTRSDASHAIAEGRLEVRRDGREQSYAAGLVTETDGEQPGRISLYCDARNVRLWSDKSIL